MRPLDALRVAGRPIAYYPKLAKHVGGVNAAIFLCQLIYWDERASDQVLGVYKMSEEWEEETGLSYREQATARSKLRDIGLLIETNKRLQHRIYYKLNQEAFNRLIEEVHAESGEIRQPTKNALPNDVYAIGGEPERRSSNTETTAETTAESKKKVVFDPATGKFSGIDDALMQKWSEAYPAVNLKTEIAKAEAWIIANPKNRKSDYLRFLNNWLNRAQDRAPRVSAVPHQRRKSTGHNADFSTKDYSAPAGMRTEL